MTDTSLFAVIIADWWESFPPRSRSRGNIAGGLVILENLRENIDLDIEAHKATGSDQLRNASRQNVQKILARFGEERTLLQEGGRTNRGLMKNLQPLLQSLADAGMDQLSRESRESEIGNMQAVLADKARDIFNAEKNNFRLQVRHDITRAGWRDFGVGSQTTENRRSRGISGWSKALPSLSCLRHQEFGSQRR